VALLGGNRGVSDTGVAVRSLPLSYNVVAVYARSCVKAFHESAFVEALRQVAAPVRVFLMRRPTLFCLVRRLPHRKEFRRKKLQTTFHLSFC